MLYWKLKWENYHCALPQLQYTSLEKSDAYFTRRGLVRINFELKYEVFRGNKLHQHKTCAQADAQWLPGGSFILHLIPILYIIHGFYREVCTHTIITLCTKGVVLQLSTTLEHTYSNFAYTIVLLHPSFFLFLKETSFSYFYFYNRNMIKFALILF